MSKVKYLLQNHKKNNQVATHQPLVSLIELIAEHLLPAFCRQHMNKSQDLNRMHNLCFLLAQKAQAVFTSGVIRTCIDQNWDMKGFRSTLIEILKKLGVEDTKKVQDYLDKTIQSQNLQTASCIKSISYYIKNPRKQIDDDDLKNPCVSFRTTVGFIKEEIQRFRNQNMKYECFQVLHPWAYDLEQVDFKYVINKDQTSTVCQALKDPNAAVFWLSYFKAQLSSSADELIGALKELCVMNQIPEYFDKNVNAYKSFMIINNYVINIKKHASDITHFIQAIVSEAQKTSKINVLKEQVLIRKGDRQKTDFINESYQGTKDDELENIGVHLVNISDRTQKAVDLGRTHLDVKTNSKQEYNLHLRFTNVDTEELKDLEIKIDGNLGQFKVGEGDFNHYIINNDKKLWESQFMIISKDGKYYIRDLGVVHTSRVKVTNKIELQLHQDSLIDLGKVVHYHVRKLTHQKVPSSVSNADFVVMKGSEPNYMTDDDAILRARPNWISQDENKEFIQNEIMIESSSKQSSFSVGRSNRRDVEIKLKAVSADHCKIEYNLEKGWYIHEKGKDRPSSNGTFVFMKSLGQMEDHEPSDLIPLFNGMVISFINYELQVRIEKKSEEEMKMATFEHVDHSAPQSVLYSQDQDTPQPHQHDDNKQSHIHHHQEQEHVEHHYSPPKSVSSQKDIQSEVQSHKSSHKQEQQPYEDDFQATKGAQHSQDLHEEQHEQAASQHSASKKSQHDDDDDQPISVKQSLHSVKKDEEVKSERQPSAQKSQRSIKGSVMDHYEGEEEPNEQKEDEEEFQRDQEESPKQKTKQDEEEDHERQVLIRSQSEHFIREAHEQSQHVNDHPEHHEHHEHHEEKKQHTPEKEEVHEEKEAVEEEAKSHHEVKSQRSQKEIHHTPEKSQHNESPHHKDVDKLENQSVKSQRLEESHEKAHHQEQSHHDKVHDDERLEEQQEEKESLYAQEGQGHAQSHAEEEEHKSEKHSEPHHQDKHHEEHHEVHKEAAHQEVHHDQNEVHRKDSTKEIHHEEKPHEDNKSISHEVHHEESKSHHDVESHHEKTESHADHQQHHSAEEEKSHNEDKKEDEKHDNQENDDHKGEHKDNQNENEENDTPGGNDEGDMQQAANEEQ